MRKKFLLPILALFLFNSLFAQVKGIVLDSSANKPIDRAVVGLVVKSNIADTAYVITNEKGEYSFDMVPVSNFSVVFHSMGYRPVAKFVPVTIKQKMIDMGIIILANQSKVLDEILIESAPITIKEDTVEYRADAFKMKPNSMVEDLLKKLPGVQVDKDGNIKAQGKSVTKIRVNGKDFFGGDVKTATRELPSDIIDKVQIVDDYGDQANISGIKDGDPDKIINLQIKKDKNIGFFGRGTAGAGTQGRYQASLNTNYFHNSTQISFVSNLNNTNASLFSFGSGANMGMGSMMKMGQSAISDMGGAGSLMSAMNNGDAGFYQNGSSGSYGITSTSSFGINYRDQWSKKVSVYGSYSYSHKNTSGYRTTSQQNFFADKVFLNNKMENTLNRGDNHRVVLNIEYQVDSFNYLKISPSFSSSGSDGNNLTPLSAFYTGDTLTQNSNAAVLNNSMAPSMSGNILYNHRFHKKGRNFSTNINLGTSTTESDQDSRNINNYFNPNYTRDQLLYAAQANDNHNYGIRMTYSEPLSLTRSLDLAYSHNFSYTRNNKSTFDIDPNTGQRIFNPFLSNDYENNYFTDRANVTVRTTTKKYNYTLGVSLQPVTLKGFSNTRDSAYKTITRVNVFPVARFAYNFSRMKTLNLSYNGNAQQPGFSQLQDVVDSSNLQYITRGNPNLKPSISHNVNLSFNNFNFVTGRIIFTSLSFNTIQNQIVNSVRRIGNSGAQFSAPVNVNGYYNATGFYTYSHPYKNRRYIITFNGTANYNHNINLTDNIETVGKNWVVSQGFNFEFNHKDWLEFGVGTNYSLNSVKYIARSGIKSSSLQNQDYSSWVISSNINMDIPKNFVLKYDFGYTINNGLATSVSENQAIMNASLEKQLFKKKNGLIRFAAYDLFNNNSSISRSVSANSVIDTRSNKLNRYFMLIFQYRIQKFKGQANKSNGPMGGTMGKMGDMMIGR